MLKHVPAHISDSIREIIKAAANLWVWSNVVDCKRLPSNPQTCWVYPSDMALGGPQIMNGHRVRVTIEIEDDNAPTIRA